MKDNSTVFFKSPSLEVPGESGCFTYVEWKKGSILEQISPESALEHLIHVDEFMADSCHSSSRFCYRFSGDMVYFSTDSRIVTDYINHSRNPNLVIYMGLTIALRDIKPGEELLADYRFLMHERFSMDCGEYSVSGFCAKDADSEFMRIMSGIRNAAV